MNSFKSKLGEYQITKKNPVKLTLTNSGKKEIQVTGNTKLTLNIPCGRCLADIETEFQFDMNRKIDTNLSEEERINNLAECNYLKDKSLDVDKLIYNEILINWPMKILCSNDCKGICNRCGTNRNKSTCDCDTTDLDPRMAVISDIFSKFKEV